MRLTDTHCHLDLQRYDNDRAEVIQKAQEAGVVRILIPGLTLASSQRVVDLARSHPMLYAAVGVHPTEARTWVDGSEGELRALIDGEEGGRKKIAAIGEIGLDYYWDRDEHEVQKWVFKKQLGLAAEVRLPVVVHFREKGDAPEGPCGGDLAGILEEWCQELDEKKNPLRDRPGVLHSFSGSLAMAERMMGLNFSIGITGPVTYSKRRQEVTRKIPLERLLLETDSPFLSPAPMQGQRNEPANISLITDKIAALLEDESERVADVTTANASRLFGWTPL